MTTSTTRGFLGAFFKSRVCGNTTRFAVPSPDGPVIPQGRRCPGWQEKEIMWSRDILSTLSPALQSMPGVQGALERGGSPGWWALGAVQLGRKPHSLPCKGSCTWQLEWAPRDTWSRPQPEACFSHLYFPKDGTFNGKGNSRCGLGPFWPGSKRQWQVAVLFFFGDIYIYIRNGFWGRSLLYFKLYGH